MTEAPDFLLRCLILAIALGPALPIGIVMASIGRRTLSPGLLGTAFAGGIIAAMLCLLGGVIVHMLPMPQAGLGKALGEAFLGAAIPEETAKFAVLAGFVLLHHDANRARDAILAGGWVGLGFALLENFYYVTASQEWLVTGAVRASLSVPGHVSWGLIMGWFLARRARGQGFDLGALGVPILLHGAFDAVLMYRDQVEKEPLPENLLFVLLFAVVLAAAWALMRWPVCAELARLDDEAAVEARMSDEAASALELAAGLSSLALIILIPLALGGMAWASMTFDLR
jgi:RsiW-degrading membrane proteinase PrsW (M82 family)